MYWYLFLSVHSHWLLLIPNTGIVNSEIVTVTDESVQKEIDINTEVLGIVNSEIVKVTDDNINYP
jgi:hypothetical protein